MNKVYLKVAVVLLLAGLSARNANAQGVGGVSPDIKMLPGTPTGGSFSSIASPNLFDGSANISIPIYQYSHDKQNYGISLSYNTKGIRVDQYASPIGTQWNIRTGAPSITRIIHDLPDETNLKGDSLIQFYIVNQVDTMVINHEMYIKGKLATYQETTEELARPNAYQDKECDEFIVSLTGKPFSFYIGKDFKVFTNPHRNIRVQVLADGVPASTLPETYIHLPINWRSIGFLITDEQGNRYYFEPETVEEYPVNAFEDWNQSGNGHSFWEPASRWTAYKVIFSNGDILAYDYNTSGQFLQSSDSGSQYTAYRSYFTTEDNGTPSFDGINPMAYPSNELTYITGITYPNGVKASFVYGDSVGNENGDPMLKEIRVSSGNNCLRYKFYQLIVNGRFFLDSITMLSCDSSSEEPYYSFEYNPLYFPHRLNSGQDLFGYYNGDSTGTPLGASETGLSIPKHGGFAYGSERAYDASFAQAGLLTKVKNAYGGEEDFFYGPNIASGQLTDSIPTDNDFIGATALDGVRLDSTIEIDRYHPGNSRKTVYSYSGGQLFLQGGYFHYPDHIDSITGYWDKVTFQSMFLTPHQMINGSNHGYSNVSIRTYASFLFGDSLLSRRDITFSNMKDATSNNKPRYYKVPGSMDYFQYPYTDKQYLKDWAIGLPLSITDYDQNNRIVQKVINKYDFNEPVDLSAASYIDNTKTARVNSGASAPYLGVGIYEYYPYKKVFSDPYYPFTGKANLERSVTLKYFNDNQYVTDTAWYYYDSHNNLSSTVSQDSKGEQTATTLVYNYDVDGPQFNGGYNPGYTAHPGTILYNMSDSGLEKVVSSERWKLHAATTTGDSGLLLLQNNDRLLDAFITGYRYQDGKLWTKSMWQTATDTSLGHSLYTGLAPGVSGNPYGNVLAAYNGPSLPDYLQQASEVKLFDEKGNPLETQLQGQNQFKAMIWDNNSGQKLADAANCHYSDIGYTGFEELYTIPYDTTVVRGNFSFHKGYIESGTGMSGYGKNKCFHLTPATLGPDGDISGTQNLQAGRTYKLSFWVKGTAPALKVGNASITLAPAQIVHTTGNWHNYQLEFTPAATGKLNFAASGGSTSTYIDEIRLCPAGAQMQSRTYEPLFGLSSETGASGRITSYEYDKFGRRTIVRDQDGNILSKTQFQLGATGL